MIGKKILLRLIYNKTKQLFRPVCITGLISSLLLVIGVVLLYRQNRIHPFLIVLGGVDAAPSIDLIRTSIYFLVIFPPILSGISICGNTNENNIIIRSKSISTWWYSIIISYAIISLFYVLWLFVLVRGITCIANVPFINMYELIGTTFLLLLSFIFFIGTLNIVILIVSKNEKYAIMVIIILLLSAFIPSRSESNIIFYLPGSWGMVLRTKELNHNGINEYLAIILNILFAFISMTVGKIIYKKRM